ncbi:hypothetical protein BTR14_02630 [Rhizobium rhizosphaerae]|uniref:DUF1289 domain-containing protein n=1 Tax=Xaviernesmea rhizosphaerae TaxID=1672749 RepID=A0ABX3PJX2_9HYPH|nr:DUF1289 domain-containing protein [Xaviernesmea rhizosphaerae]OQP88493.1 hypothetical protein BTR14_02630 [Xaviernesmea rhizosphaerae]
MQSPCIHICSIDARSGLCLGCARTLEEIGAWATLGDQGRARIMTQLAARRIRAGLPDPSRLPLQSCQEETAS